MKWLEIVSLRTGGIKEKEARQYMQKFCRIADKHHLSRAFVYVHSSIPGDLSLMIFSDSSTNNIMGSDLGKYMAEVLKPFGLVDYNCWLRSDPE